MGSWWPERDKDEKSSPQRVFADTRHERERQAVAEMQAGENIQDVEE
jgi:hypothetical protein